MGRVFFSGSESLNIGGRLRRWRRVETAGGNHGQGQSPGHYFTLPSPLLPPQLLTN